MIFQIAVWAANINWFWYFWSVFAQCPRSSYEFVKENVGRQKVFLELAKGLF